MKIFLFAAAKNCLKVDILPNDVNIQSVIVVISLLLLSLVSSLEHFSFVFLSGLSLHSASWFLVLVHSHLDRGLVGKDLRWALPIFFYVWAHTF